jgi:hypothetical protein
VSYARLGVALLVGLLSAMDAPASEAGHFEADCVRTISVSLPKRPHQEHQLLCRCIRRTSERLGVTSIEFAAERARMRRDPAGTSVGRIHQAVNECFDSMVRSARPSREPGDSPSSL